MTLGVFPSRLFLLNARILLIQDWVHITFLEQSLQ